MSEDLAWRFIEKGEEEARALVRTMVEAGESERMAEAIIGELAGEDLWRRDRVLDLLIRVPEAKALLPHFAHALHEDTRVDRRNGARSALTALATPASVICADGVATLSDLVLKPKDSDVRLLAAAALGESGNARGRVALEAALRDTDVNVSSAAAESLGTIGDRRAVAALLTALEGSGFWTRAAAIIALGVLRDERALDALTPLLKDPLLASAAARALGEIGQPVSMIPLAEALDSTPQTRAAALDAIARLYGEHPRMDLPDNVARRILEAETDLLQRLAAGDDLLAARLLGMGASDTAVDELIAAAALEETRPTAEVGLSSIPPSKRLGLLLPRLAAAASEAQAVIVGVLPPLSSSAEVDQLIPLLADERPEIRDAASQVLGSSNPELVRSALTAALGQPASRAGAAIALARSTRDPAAILELVDDPDPTVRSAVADGLGRTGGALSTMIEWLEGESNLATRQRLIAAIGRTGGDEADAPLVSLMERGGAVEKFAAVRALGVTRSATALEPLLSALTDAAPEVRIAAITALGELGDSRAAAAVEGHLTDPDDRDIRRTAARAFDLIAATEGINRLSIALDDPDREVRLTAVAAVRRVGGRAALDALEERADAEADSYVRAAATRALVDLRDQLDSDEG